MMHWFHGHQTANLAKLTLKIVNSFCLITQLKTVNKSKKKDSRFGVLTRKCLQNRILKC